jgi:hypothetical protein
MEAWQNLLVLVGMVVSIHYLGSVNLNGDATAKNQFDRILELLDNHGMDRRKIVGLVVDGCNTMTGDHAGLAGLFRKQIAPHIMVMHCIAHRLNLVAQWAIDKSSNLVLKRFNDYFNDVVSDVLAVFNKSSRSIALFAALAKELDEAVLKFEHPATTRWLSRASLMKALMRNMRTMLDFSAQDYAALGIDEGRSKAYLLFDKLRWEMHACWFHWGFLLHKDKVATASNSTFCHISLL